MSYQEFDDAFEALRDPIGKITSLYDAARVAADNSGAINPDGSVSVDYGQLRKALDILPPGNDERIDRMIGGFEHGFAMIGGLAPTPLAPWSAFEDAQALRPFDTRFWRALRFIGPKAKPFAGIDNVPPDVLDPANMAMLQELANTAPNYVEIAAQPATQLATMAWRSELLRLSPAKMAEVVVPAKDDTGTSTGALKIDDFAGAVSCLQKASYRLVGWGFVLEICVDKACADELEKAFSFGTSGLVAVGTAALTAGFTSAAVGAAVAAVGGWVAFFIMISVAYWALMIHLNKTSKGVCLYIPMPWTLGAIGPGWAVGI